MSHNPARTEYRVLGPLEVRVDRVPVPLGRGREQRIMAALLLDVGRVVPVGALVDAVWDDEPPPTAAKLVRNGVSALRARLTGAPGAAIGTRPSGYVLQIGDGHLDAAEFAERAAAAASNAAAGRLADAIAESREALGLWRGTAFAGLPGRAIQAAAAGLDEQRLRVLEDCVSYELALGGGPELVAELTRLVADEPLRERLRAQLMQALYRCGRRAEALETYRAGRRVLVEQLGIEPGPELRRLEQDILNDAPALAVARPQGPAQLPAGAASFTGRADHLGRLDAALRDVGEGTAGSVVISVIGGMAGVGKTALAVHWAHRVRGRFPDGQLFVNLYGYGPNPPVRPLDALAHFLRALGVGADQVPVDVDEAAALYRSLLADRRVLVVVDNAADVEQVRPLLPGAPGCLVLVTSRVRLSGLIVREDARPVTLDVLDPDEAGALLSSLAGAARVGAEPVAAARLAELCAYLPLALRIAAAHLADRPRLRIADYVARLAAGDRLTALAVEGDPECAVRGAFDLSYEALDPAARLVFRRLGLAPGSDTHPDAVGALAGLPASETVRALARLTGAHLVDEIAADRFTLHDLLREYAADRCAIDDDAPARQAASGRLFDWYQGQVDAAATVLYPEITRVRRPSAAPTGPGTRTEALEWLDAERANLVAVTGCAADRGRPEVAWQLGDALRGYFHLRMYTVDWLTVATAQLAAGERDGDAAAQAAACLSLGDLHWRISRYPQAIEHYRAAEVLAAAAGWEHGERAILGNLGNVYQQAGMLAEAEERYGRALASAERAGSLVAQAAHLDNLGAVYWEIGRLPAAAEHLSKAARTFDETGSVFGHAIAVSGLGEVRHAQGLLGEAGEHLTHALRHHREVGNRGGEAETTRLLAAVARDEGRLADARALADTALTLTREAGDRRFEADALNTAASILLADGASAGAIAGHEAALRLATEIGNRYPEVEALIGLSMAHRSRGATNYATAYAEQAVAAAHDAGYRLLEGTARAALDDRDPLANAILRECGVLRRATSGGAEQSVRSGVYSR